MCFVKQHSAVSEQHAGSWVFWVTGFILDAYCQIGMVMLKSSGCFAELEGAPKALLTEVIRLLETQGKAQ